MAEPVEFGPFRKFGEWLQEVRVAAKLRSQSQAEIRARQRGLSLINQGKLSHIERGHNGNPDPEFFEQLARLYKIDYAQIVLKWAQVKYSIATDVDSGLDRDPHVKGSDPRQGKGGSGVPASDDATAISVRELQVDLDDAREELAAYKVIVQHIRRLGDDIVTASSAESSEAVRAQAARVRRHRKNA